MHDIRTGTGTGTPARWRRAALLLPLAVALAGCAVPDGGGAGGGALPAGFVALQALAPDIVQDMRYHGTDNPLGRRAAGYEAARCLLAEPAARALQAAQAELRAQGLALKVFDCYRPQAAVDEFVRWARDPADQTHKAAHSPEVPKEALFERGHIAAASAHSRGSAVDLTLVVTDAERASQAVRGPLAQGEEVDMGTPFDWFGAQSRTDHPALSPDVQHNRRWLRALLARHGLRNLPQEWWHYTLQAQAYPDRTFNFPVR